MTFILGGKYHDSIGRRYRPDIYFVCVAIKPNGIEFRIKYKHTDLDIGQHTRLPYETYRLEMYQPTVISKRARLI